MTTNLIVARFGGDAAVNAEAVRKSAEIAKADPARRYIVVSAPGSAPGKIGITDLLYMLYANFHNKENYINTLMDISARYKEIVDGLGIDFDVDAEIAAVKKNLELGSDVDHIASRGEYIIAKIFAKLLGWEFVDASRLICFKQNGDLDKQSTFIAAGDTLSKYEHAVIPSFYGAKQNGNIKTFARGDCDTAGAMIACAVKADVFEKWSEHDKVYSADPHVIPHPEVVTHITYNEAVELNYIGIPIIKDEDIFMLNEAGITMTIRTIDDPDEIGMHITPKLPENISRNVTACIAGHNKFSVVRINKYGLNSEADFNEKLFGIFAKHNIACRHYLSGIHKMSIILKSPVFDLRLPQIINDIKGIVRPDSVKVEKGLSLIAIVAEGMGTEKGVFSQIFMALATQNIKVKMIDQGSDDLNIIIGVLDEDYARAVKALYKGVVLNFKGE